MGFSDDDEKLSNLIASANAISQDKSIVEDDDFIRGFFGDVFELAAEEMSRRNNDDYEVDPENMQHLFRAYRFFIKKAHEHNGKIDPFVYNPKEEVGHLDAHFFYFELSGDDLLGFSEILSHASAVSIDATLDGCTHFSMVFPAVYRKK